jgi:hypothetical protein
MPQDQPQPKYLQLSPEDLEKVRRRKERESGSIKVDEFDLLVAEFGMFYGYTAVLTVLNDDITLADMLRLLEAARRVDARNQYNQAAAVFTAVASANSKRPAAAFNANSRSYVKRMKADA